MKNVILVSAVLTMIVAAAPQSAAPERYPDVPYVPSPEEVVDHMLQLANVHEGDIVYDLGCGDGRIVVAAAKKFGARRAIGVDIDPQRIQEARANAEKAGVAGKTKFIQGDLFDADIHDATVVTLYLLPSVNEKLKPKLLKDLKPGTRVVSHSFDMGDWQPDKTDNFDGRRLYLWIIPGNKK
jgi:SAM-dependent methyltransferase